jgi:hypothetical protein
VAEARLLGEEVVSHLRQLVGPERLLGAFNAARARVRTQRTSRRARAAVRGGLGGS